MRHSKIHKENTKVFYKGEEDAKKETTDIVCWGTVTQGEYRNDILRYSIEKKLSIDLQPTKQRDYRGIHPATKAEQANYNYFSRDGLTLSPEW